MPAHPIRRGSGRVVAGLALTALASAGAPLRAQVVEKPRLRWQYFYEPRAYPFPEIPAGAFRVAARAYRARWPQMQALPGAPAAATDTAWQPIGPSNIPGLAIQSTGRLTAIALHPTDPAVIYVGGAQGGVWKTTNAIDPTDQIHWAPLTDRECSLATGWLVVDPVDPNIVYAATGEQHFSGDSYYGCGILRSTDGGATWTQVGASVFDVPATGSGGARIARIVLDPRTAGTDTGATLLVAADNGVWRSADGGASWTQVLAGTATDLVMDPVDPDVLYAALGHFARTPANGIYRSGDGGATWTKLTNGLPAADVGRINIAIAPSQPSILYASIQNAFESPAASSDGTLLGIYKTTDAGASWVPVATSGSPPTCNTQCWYDMALAVHPNDPDTVFFGGVPLYRSVDGGQTFESVGTGSGGLVHVDQHVIVYDPRDPATVYVGNDGGIYRSRAGGAPGTWESLNSDIAITQFYPGIALHPTDPAIVLGGTQDNGTLRFSGSLSWDHVLGGDGGYTAIDHQQGRYSYAETQWLPNSGYSGPQRSDDGGPFSLKVNGIDLSDRAQFIPPLVMDPGDSDVLYFGTFRVYRTEDRGETWTAISPDLAGQGRTITAVAPARTDPGMIYVGTNGGRIQRTADGGGVWVDASAGLPQRAVTDIAVDPHDADIAFATVSGFFTDHVFRTVDGGASWTSISGDLPDVPANAIAVDARSSSILYVGTDLGVFRTVDGGASWHPLNVGLPNVAVFDLAIGSRTGMLVAATHGRGMFQRELGLAVVAVSGTVKYYAGGRDPVPEVLVTGSGSLAGTQVTGLDGTYAIVGIAGGAATVTPGKVGGQGGALSALDAAWMLQCAAGTRACAGDQVIAADVSGDGVVREEDARVLLDYLVEARPGLPAGEWRFEPQTREYPLLNVDQAGQDFTAIVIGDATGSWRPGTPRPPIAGQGIGAVRVAAASASAAGTVALRTLGAQDGSELILALEASLPGETILGVEAALELARGVEVLGVEPAAAATGFLLAHREEPGRMRIAMASATGIPSGGSFALIRIRTSTGSAGATIAMARVNEQPAGGTAIVELTELPAAFALAQNAPNPFTAGTGTRLLLEVPAGDGALAPQRVRLHVYDVRGTPVRRLVDESLEPGRHPVTWDGRDDSGVLLPSGVYIAVAEMGGTRRRVRMLFLR